MKNNITRIKAYFLSRTLKVVGIIFGFGSISFMTMCAKYGDITDFYGTIKGKVTSSATGETIENIEINIKVISISAKTNNLGNYFVKYLPPDTYTIEAKDIDGAANGEFQNAAKTLTLNPEELVDCDFVLNPK